ncbi:MAG: 30S ribosomal protein S4 [Halobacteriota archaeon]
MGHPKRSKKTYERPRRPWVLQRIKEEQELVEQYGLKNKREIWKAASRIKKYRREIRNILAEIAGMKPTEHTKRKEEAILASLRRKGLLSAGTNLEDILELDVVDVLKRRLQTCVHKKGLATSLKHARQLIVHGHIAVNNRRVTVPSYIVNIEEERGIGYYEHAPVSITANAGERAEGVEEGTGELIV